MQRSEIFWQEINISFISLFIFHMETQEQCQIDAHVAWRWTGAEKFLCDLEGFDLVKSMR